MMVDLAPLLDAYEVAVEAMFVAAEELIAVPVGGDSNFLRYLAANQAYCAAHDALQAAYDSYRDAGGQFDVCT